ncbi:MAG TPA: hypothetical protein VHA35_16815 [Dongiaceae bacterium]|jgi:hypothetical protein|nr:hypothetical protein [Dongiaceae bacterium]
MQPFAPPAFGPRAERARLRKEIAWLLALKTLALVVLFLILNAGPARHEPTPEFVGAHLAAPADAQ